MKSTKIGGLLLGLMVTFSTSEAQQVSGKLDAAVQKLLRDPSMHYAALSLTVLDAQTGKVVYSHQPNMGLAPASTLKVMTAMAAFAKLGADFRYTTNFGYTGELADGLLNGNLVLNGAGDPTLGSWRFSFTTEKKLLTDWRQAVLKAGIKQVKGSIVLTEDGWTGERTPDGWIWQDIGNYYGAGAGGINWRENQFDVLLKSGDQPGTPVQIQSTNPASMDVQLQSELLAGARGSGDNAYIYLPPGARSGVIRGTIPAGESRFTISGAIPNPPLQLKKELENQLKSGGVSVSGAAELNTGKASTSLYQHQSPTLDTMAYWFLKKSINLYGEALLKTMAASVGKKASTEEGVKQLVTFWKDRGVAPGSLQIMDGSGLSPQNRVSTQALVTALYWASKQEWYNAFYHALPVYNGMKLKSGSIGGARAYAGYHTARDGKKYVVAIIVNNYQGSAAAAVKQLFSVLDQLK